MKKVAVLQSNYLPWVGYFDLISYVDEFILFDSMQYTKRDWRNRNMIKTPNGKKWLTIPVQSKGKFEQSIAETKVSDINWSKDHWKSIQMNYSGAPFFKEISNFIEPLYEMKHTNLSMINSIFIKEICNYLNIKTLISHSSQFSIKGDKSQRLVNICIEAGANYYVSGPSAKDYLDTDLFENYNIEVEWFKYGEYPSYSQLWGPFESHVSIIDTLFNCGPETSKHLKKCII
tara:strand:- start:173 stop:865 length:693 start_codon:yes stop_codon:yes gene_type:complete